MASSSRTGRNRANFAPVSSPTWVPTSTRAEKKSPWARGCIFSTKALSSRISKKSLVHISKVLAVDEDTRVPDDVPSAVKPIQWAEFKTNGYDDFWKELTNFKEFAFVIGYLRPFVPITGFERDVYEAIIRYVATPMDLQKVSCMADKNNDRLLVTVAHDVLGGTVALDSDSLAIAFQNDDLQLILKKLPQYMRALGAVAATPQFVRVFGKAFDRATTATLKFRQIIKILGKGRLHATPANNRDLIQKLVNLGMAYKTKGSPLDSLAPISDSASRIDLNIGFERQIDAHQYTIFLTLQAPTNEDSSYLWLAVEVQDHSPGPITTRNYTPLLTDFLRDSYFNTFLKELFGDIECTTLGSK